MKNILSIGGIGLFVLMSCSKKEPAAEDISEETKPSYDTVAVDSFSNGAISVDVARQIRMSSQKYQDSLKEAEKMKLEEQRIQEELDKENNKKKEEEKKSKQGQPVNSSTEDPK
ncbi:hypothetical protein N0B16_09080 [Chryseobacterium sp. GMJ5]|uniref:Lipoprotein n=1 Tax=Chryseobacterium gilvum TaxID=2976534 RepID=A0ABT2VXF9_9FLAO|nr:hypothetical protein [Chryseobacterium gilvum]MCU7614586.1 hypothetical protein [Chryseobacterium gilvum]